MLEQKKRICRGAPPQKGKEFNNSKSALKKHAKRKIGKKLMKNKFFFSTFYFY